MSFVLLCEADQKLERRLPVRLHLCYAGIAMKFMSGTV